MQQKTYYFFDACYVGICKMFVFSKSEDNIF